MHRISCRLPALLGTFLLASASLSQAVVILQIDISDPSAVVFSATGEVAQNTQIDESWLSEGFTLMNFLSGDPGTLDTSFEAPSNLYSPGGTFAYTLASNTSATNPMGPPTDLTIYGSGFSFQNFSSSEPAFTGSAVIDLSPWISFISPGVGDIYSGDFISFTGPFIGQYEVIPEPATTTLLVAGAAALLHFARRRRMASTR